MEGTTRNHDWDEYEQLVELFKYYFELVLKTLTATSAISGAIIAYILKQEGINNFKISSFGLLLPALICFAIGTGFLQVIPSMKELTMALDILRKKLNLTLTPHTDNLIKTLKWAGAILILSSILLVCLFFYLFNKEQPRDKTKQSTSIASNIIWRT